MIFAVARASPMVRTTNPMRRFSAANTCSTRLRTRARVVLPRAIWAGIGLAARLGPSELRHQPPLSEQRQVGLPAIGGVRPDTARGVGGIEHAGELAAIMACRMGHGEAADEAVPAIDADVVLVAEHRHRDLRPLTLRVLR